MSEISKCESYLLDIPKFKKKTLLSDTIKFYELLGRPGEDIPRIHVAGTNGKGSTCFYTSQILKNHGLSVALFTSPHLVSMKERFVIDDRMISDEEFIRVFNQVKNKCESLDEETKEAMHPSFFEFLFLMFMLWVSEVKPDVLILETGLGGMLDATNIFETSALSVICSIGLDHIEQLGNSIEEIAAQKAGIIKNNVAVVSLDNDFAANQVIKERALAKNAPLYLLKEENISNVSVKDKHVDFSLNFSYDNSVCVDEMRISLETSALYQRFNASMAVLVSLIYLKDRFDEKLTVEALSKGSFKGRMEEIHPGFFVDGAHNEDAVDKLLETLLQVEGTKTLIFGACKDKDYETMLEKIIKSNVFDSIVLTKVHSPRAAEIEDLLRITGKCNGSGKEIRTAGDVEKAIRMLDGEEGIKYIAGSLYLVGEAMDYIRRMTDD